MMEITENPVHTISQSFAVSFDYPVSFVRGLFDENNPLLTATLNRRGENRLHRAAVYVDGGLAAANPELIEQIKNYFHVHREEMELAAGPRILPGGTACKRDYALLRDVMSELGNCHLDRQSAVIAVGGGSMLDAVGLAVSLVHRGLRLVRCPSTVLAQNDAGVGVKNGMDEHGQKNFIGTFAPPFAVLCDLDFLETLSDTDWVGGVAEAFKVAIIKDVAFFDFLCEQAAALKARDAAAMETLVKRCAEIHLEHIRTSGDPFEFGSARPLDFGHWAAHRLEIVSDHALRHGQAVAIGMALDSTYAAGEGLIGEDELERILAGLHAAGLPIFDPLLAEQDGDGELKILKGLEQFREHLGGALNVTLPAGLGGSVEVHHMNPGGVAAAVEQLARRAEG